MRPASLNALERNVLELFVAGSHPALEVLRKQLVAARVKQRDLTGQGFLVHFELPEDVPRVRSPRNLVLDDVGAEFEGLESPAEFQLFVDDGVMESLECAVFGEEWPEEPRLRRAFYLAPDPRGSGNLIKTYRRNLEPLLAEWQAAEQTDE